MMSTKLLRKVGDWAEILEVSSEDCYYYNRATGETTWDCPSEVMEANGALKSKEQAEKASEQYSEIVAARQSGNFSAISEAAKAQLSTSSSLPSWMNEQFEDALDEDEEIQEKEEKEEKEKKKISELVSDSSDSAVKSSSPSPNSTAKISAPSPIAGDPWGSDSDSEKEQEQIQKKQFPEKQKEEEKEKEKSPSSSAPPVIKAPEPAVPVKAPPAKPAKPAKPPKSSKPTSTSTSASTSDTAASSSFFTAKSNSNSSSSNPFGDSDDEEESASVSTSKATSTSTSKAATSSLPVAMAVPIGGGGVASPNSNNSNSNPFGEDDDDDDSRKGGGGGGGGGGNGNGNGNPFGDDGDDIVHASVVGADVRSPNTIFVDNATGGHTKFQTEQQHQQQQHHKVLPPPPKAAGLHGFAYKAELQRMMLMGFQMRYSKLMLEKHRGYEENASKEMLEVLKERPKRFDNQLWKQVTSARVISWLPNMVDPDGSGEICTVYIVNVTMDVPYYSQWKVHCRFKKLKNLYDSISGTIGRHIPGGLKVPFPSSTATWFRSGTDDARSKRMYDLDLWLKELCKEGVLMGRKKVKEVLWDMLRVENNLTYQKPAR